MEGIPMESAKGIAELYEKKMNAALDRDADEREMVEYSFAQLLDLLAEVGQRAREITVDEDHAAAQLSGLLTGAERLRQQAEQAERARREDLAWQALTQREAIRVRLPDMQREEEALRHQGKKLSAAEDGIREKIDEFRAQEETLLGTGRGTLVRTGIDRIFADIRNEIEDADIAACLAEDNVTNLKSQARALHDLIMPRRDDAPAAGGWPQWDFDEIRAVAMAEEELAEIRRRVDEDGGNGPAGAAAPAG
jgi:phage shock protein A